jgi:hypothetical protein
LLLGFSLLGRLGLLGLFNWSGLLFNLGSFLLGLSLDLRLGLGLGSWLGLGLRGFAEEGIRGETFESLDGVLAVDYDANGLG